MRERDIFIEALQREAPTEREAYLATTCAGDVALRQRVEELLAEHDKQESFFLDVPPPGLEKILEQPTVEVVGMQIGPYQLLQQIGEGGMGMVYMAEQSQPIARRVALKIIKPGMDTRQVIARFEAERQALSLMDHVNISRVLDAGATETGRPYFVMELVDGVPITKYCDDNHLMPRQRLELFVPVCQAIQHAHQKGIIHRDIKPSNILVTLYDGKPVPKVIDFGVAKATSQVLAEKTMFTGLGQIIGTLEYMSPEQARVNQLDIDTRSDIYSLGVLLYELLTGSTPFDKHRLRSAAWDEMLRIIREEAPPKPSTRLSETRSRDPRGTSFADRVGNMCPAEPSEPTLATIAAVRSIEPARLTNLVRGELDWIVMKALEKDRSRRYESANGLAADVQRYLNDEPVQACPPSSSYRFRKFTRRNKAALTTASLVALTLLLGTVISTWQAVRATRALTAESAARQDADKSRREANAEAQKAKTEAAIAQAVNDFLNQDLLAQANDDTAIALYQQRGSELTLLTVLNRAAARIEGRFQDQPLVEATLRQTIGSTYQSLGERTVDLSRAAKHLQRAMELRQKHLGSEHPDTLASMAGFALATRDAALSERVLTVRRRVLGNDHPATLRSIFRLAYVLDRSGDQVRGLKTFREALEAQSRVLGEDHFSTAWTKHLLACVQHGVDGHAGPDGLHGAEIERLYREALTTLTKSSESSWYTYDVTLRMGQFLSFPGHYERAEKVLLDGYSRLKSHRSTPPEWAATLAGELAGLYRNWNKLEQVAQWDQKRKVDAEAALARSRRIVEIGGDDASLLLSHAALLIQSDELGEAESYQSVVFDPQAKGEYHHLLGDAYLRRNDWPKAERHYAQALASWREVWGDESTQVGSVLHTLAAVQREKGDLPAAEATQSEALAIVRKRFGDRHAATAIEVHDLAYVLGRIPGRELEAERLFREALQIRRQVQGVGDVAAIDTAFRLAQVLGNQQKFEEAEALLQESYAALVANRASGQAQSFQPVLLQWIIEQYRNWNKPEQAAQWQQRQSTAHSQAL